MRTLGPLALALCAGSMGAVTGLGPVEPAQVDWRPRVPLQGSLVLIVVRPSVGDSVIAVRGELAREPLHFERVDGGFRAVGGVPLEARGRVVAQVVIERAAGGRDTVTAALPVARRRTPRERLRTDPAFVQPPESLAPRIQAERELVRALKRRAHDTPRLWDGPFVRPHPAAVTSGFGTRRTFNGVVRSRHLGVDFDGRLGEPVLAANRGVVVMAEDLYYSGTTVFIDHGAGLVTGYLHLSRTYITAGDTVSPGQLIGHIGASGRVTGPHLHWTAAYGRVSVDPLDLLAIDLAAPIASQPSRAEPSRP